nr:hypothetical protein [Tanacetum cinerariifolium]
MDVHVHNEVPSNQTPTLLIIPVSVITESSPILTIVIPQSLPPLLFHLIKSIITESIEHAVLAKESLQPKSTYEAAATLIEFELKKILIDKIDESQSYLIAAKNRECYDRLIKSYDLDRNQGLKKRKTSKDAEPTIGPKTKESKYGSSKGSKSQSKSFGKSVQTKELEFEVGDSDMPQNQEVNLEPKGKVASKRDWFTKPKRPQEPPDPDWNEGKTPQKGPTQSWLMTLASSADKPILCMHHEWPEDHKSNSRNTIRVSIQTSQRHTF